MKEKKNSFPKAKKFDKLKPRISIIPQMALMEVVKGFEYGANKYGEFNYSGGMPIRRYIDASWRHTNQFLLGEDIDEESKVHHLALVACNALMALENLMTGNKKEIDNRNLIYKTLKTKK